MFNTPQQFAFDLQVAYFRASEKHLEPGYLRQFVEVFTTLYLEEFPFPLPLHPSNDLKLKITYKEKAYHLFLKTCAKSLIVFTANAPQLCLEQPASNSFLTQPGDMYSAIYETGNLSKYTTSQAAIAFRLLATVFTEMQSELKSAGLFNWNTVRPEVYSYTNARHPGEFEDHYRVSWSEASDAVRNAWRRREEKYDDAERDALEKATKEAYGDLTALQIAMLGTPLFPFANRLVPHETTETPFELPPKSRFAHQWVISPTGGGKTTLLESQIIRDLDKVARGQCSVVVIDSQAIPGEPSLIPNLAGLKVFAPGQPLEGKLILLEPDPEYPLALNPFDRPTMDGLSSRDRDIYEISAAEMISFSLSAMSDQQDDLFTYVIQFLMSVPSATIDDLATILEPKGLENYRRYLDRADPAIQKFFNTMFDSKGFQPTRDAVARRVAGVMKNKTFRHMFQSKKNKFNMAKELSEPKVILINTDMAYLGAGACQLFGRFFISQIVQMVQTRGAGLPVFCYIDEVHDYLFAEDKNLEFLNDKARKRNVGMIYAHQRLSNIKSPGVLDSLCNLDIQFAGGNRTDAKLLAGLLNTTPELIQSMPLGNFMTFVKRHTPAAIQLEVKPLMPHMAPMTDAEMREIKRQMRERYARPLYEIPTPEATHPEPQRPTGPPKDDEYDDRYDQLDQITLSPSKARSGTVLTVNCPNGRTHQQSIPPGMHNGYRFCVKGASKIRRPDNRNGNYWVELEIPEMPGARPTESRPEEDETDAKPW